MQHKIQNHLSGLDLVKVVAIVWICLFHLIDLRTGWQIGTMYGSGTYWEFFANMGHGSFAILTMALISLGTMGVNLFIIASGLGLSISANKKKSSYTKFLKKRVSRVFPYYWLILFAILFFELSSGNQVNFFDYFLHFFGLNNFFPEYVLSISAPFWFIGTILQLYLLFPFIFKLSKKIHPVLILVFALLLKVFLDPLIINFFDGGRFFTEYIIDFAIGIVIGNMIFKKPFRLSILKFIPIFAIFVLTIATIISTNLYSIYPLFFPLIFQLAAALLFIMLFYFGNLFSNKKLLYLSSLASLSFIVYLTHYYFLTKFFSRIVFKLPFIIEACVFLILSFFLAILVNYFVKILSKIKKIKT